MSTQLMIYRSAVPVSKSRHADYSVEGTSDFAFCARILSVPLLAVEFPAAAGEFPIAFSGKPGEIISQAILGVRENENLYVSAGHKWTARYIPAFLRRYPFVYSRAGDQFVLHIDEAYPGLNREGRGQKLFNPDETPTAYLQGVIKFLNDFHVEFERTRALSEELATLGLLDRVEAQVNVTENVRFALKGLLVVDRPRLRALSGETLDRLLKTDALEVLFLHLNSLRNFDLLRERIGVQRMRPQADEDVFPPKGAARRTLLH